MSDRAGLEFRINDFDDFAPITGRVKASFAQGKLGKVRITDASNGLKIAFRGLVAAGIARDWPRRGEASLVSPLRAPEPHR